MGLVFHNVRRNSTSLISMAGEYDMMPRHMVLTTIGCQPCKALEAYLNANNTNTWQWVYHHIQPDLFDTLKVHSTPTIVKQTGPLHYEVMATGLDESILYHKQWLHPSSIVTGDEEE